MAFRRETDSVTLVMRCVEVGHLGSAKNNLSECRVILREPRRLKNPLGVREILRSLGLPQDDMNRLEFCNLFFREPLLLVCTDRQQVMP